MLPITRCCRRFCTASLQSVTHRHRHAVTSHCPLVPASPLSHVRRGISSRPPLLQSASPSPSVSHDSRFGSLSDADISTFRSLLPADGAVVSDADELAAVSVDWMRKFRGRASLLLRPGSTQEVAAVLRHCNERRLAVVPQGGNTGLVGGSVPVSDELVLSLSRMNRVLEFDAHAGIVTVESGVVLEQLSNWLEPKGFIVPLDLGAKGTCQLGGNVSTNAGGLRLVRYGSLHGSVLGVEVVTAAGQILDLTSTLRKDNTGYDLKQLFIGAEGTLGVVTKVNIVTPRRPTSVQVAFLGLDSFERVLDAMLACRAQLSDILSAVEFLDRQSMELVLRHIPAARDPLQSPCPFYMLIETSGTNAQHDAEKLSAFLETQLSASPSSSQAAVKDGTIAQDETQQKALWLLREHITDALGKQGAVYKYDVSLPVTEFYALVTSMRRRLQPLSDSKRVGVVGYGHLGDSNLHLNVHCRQWDAEVQGLIEPWLFEQVRAVRGSISAEHGLGQAKARYIHYSKTPQVVEMMRRVKDMMDPNGILNPYKLLPPPELQTTAEPTLHASTSPVRAAIQ